LTKGFFNDIINNREEVSIMTLGERIKKVRKVLDLTQREFGERIAMKQNSVAQIEMGRNTSDQTIFTICREFDVNETWLRTGEGEMFAKLPENEELEKQIRNLMKGGNNSFRERMISLLLHLKPEHWEAIEHYALKLLDTRDKAKPKTEFSEPVGNSDKLPTSEPTPTDLTARLDALERETERVRRENAELRQKIQAMEEEDN